VTIRGMGTIKRVGRSQVAADSREKCKSPF
jgi:hypothetical protein